MIYIKSSSACDILLPNLYLRMDSEDFIMIVMNDSGNILQTVTLNVWSIYERDVHGRVLYNRTSSGYWEKYTRDVDGNELSYINSCGFNRARK